MRVIVWTWNEIFRCQHFELILAWLSHSQTLQRCNVRCKSYVGQTIELNCDAKHLHNLTTIKKPFSVLKKIVITQCI